MTTDDITKRISDMLCDEWDDDIGPTTHRFNNIGQWADHVASVLVTKLPLHLVEAPSMPHWICYATDWEQRH